MQVLYRCVLAVGTLVHGDASTAELCAELCLSDSLRDAAAGVSEPTAKLRRCVDDVLRLIEHRGAAAVASQRASPFG